MTRIIGLAPAPAFGKPEESCMSDAYRVGHNYIKRTLEAGCIPVGLSPADNWLTEDQLDMCDAFLVQGGSEFYPYHFQIMEHVLKTGKKYLGICLGEQVIYVYLKLKQIVEERGYEGDIVHAMVDYIAEQPEGFTLQKRIPDHRYPRPERGNEDTAKHDVNIIPGTILHRLVGKDTMRLCSFHYLCTPPEQTLVKINAWSAKGDNVVEGTEYGDNILGVQGHPEADNLLPEIFAFLAEE